MKGVRIQHLFLKTVGAVINVKEGTLSLEFDGATVHVNFFRM